DRVKWKLYNLGFIHQALKELEEITMENEPHLKRLASWELALWHANQYTKTDAEQCIIHLPDAIKGTTDHTLLRRAAILEAESLHILGKTDQAKGIIEKALALETHPDLYLAMASLEPSVEQRVRWINKVYSLTDESTVALEEAAATVDAYDRLSVPHGSEHQPNQHERAKVTVIIPVYNAADVIHTSLTSIQKQTWANLEILIVDDCSTDHTYDIACQYAQNDSRIKVLQTPVNSGAYTARNTALKVATGD